MFVVPHCHFFLSTHRPVLLHFLSRILVPLLDCPRPALSSYSVCPATFITHLLHGPPSPALSSVEKNQHLARRYRPAISYLTICFSYRSLAANTDMGFAIVSPTTVSHHVHQPVSLRRNHHAWKEHYDKPRRQFLRIALSLVARASFNSATT